MQELKLTEQMVEKIFKKCLFKKKEIVDGKPIIDPKIAEGVRATFGFHPERLSLNYNIISSLIDQLPKIDDGPNFTDLCYTKEGKLWTGAHLVVEQLVVLGVASGILFYPVPKKIWAQFPGTPWVIRKKGSR